MDSHEHWIGVREKSRTLSIPIGSMYGIFTYIWVIYGVNAGKYSIHGSYGILDDGIHHDFRLPGCHPIQQQCHQLGHCWWCGGGSCGRGCLLHAARQEEEDQAWPEAWGVFDAGNGIVFFLEEIRGRGSLWHESTLIWRGEGVMVFGMVAQPLISQISRSLFPAPLPDETELGAKILGLKSRVATPKLFYNLLHRFAWNFSFGASTQFTNKKFNKITSSTPKALPFGSLFNPLLHLSPARRRIR